MADVVKKKVVAAEETQSQKLTRLANKRVNKAIVYIRLIGNLGAYGPNTQQQNTIIQAIASEVKKMEQNIRSTSPVTAEEFKLA